MLSLLFSKYVAMLLSMHDESIYEVNVLYTQTIYF